MSATAPIAQRGRDAPLAFITGASSGIGQALAELLHRRGHRLALVARGGVSAAGLGLVLGLTAWAGPARLVRARMLAVRALPFVEAARAAGLSPVRVWWHHALPHALRPLQTALPLSLAGLLALESTLSFLGVGLPPEVASWGQQLAAARQAPQAWWATIFPALMLATTILSVHFSVPRTQPRPANAGGR